MRKVGNFCSQVGKGESNTQKGKKAAENDRSTEQNEIDHIFQYSGKRID
jgi:hypothetical protein